VDIHLVDHDLPGYRRAVAGRLGKCSRHDFAVHEERAFVLQRQGCAKGVLRQPGLGLGAERKRAKQRDQRCFDRLRAGRADFVVTVHRCLLS
jgi:hypothetical protein